AFAGSISVMAEVRVPAYTAYSEPGPEAVHVSRRGITEWNDRNTKILWFGEFKHSGEIQCSLLMRVPNGGESKLRLTLAGASRESAARGAPTNPLGDAGPFTLPTPGYYPFALQSLNSPDRQPGDIEALILDGPAAADAHYNLKQRRNAASVHLFYPTK